MAKMTIKDLEVQGKRVLVRVDFNVRVDESGQITDDRRIKAALPTIRDLAEKGGRVILVSHFGRPKGVDDRLRMDQIGLRLQELIGKKVVKVNDCIGEEVKKAVAAMEDGDILLLENVRFYKEETANDPEFARQLAELADLY
ncbi:MAG: phosphoglycerate kinase, partial [Firmicutes bacterium]|nr:phosphoglycerate kinase [Bacillota bacterium]